MLNLEDKFLIYKSRYENYASFDDQVLAYETKSINTYAGQTYENFLREYETAKFKAIQKVSLFFENKDYHPLSLNTSAFLECTL